MSTIRLLSLVFFFGLLFVHPGFAQQITTGTIQGTVADATGASLPGVTVEARHQETNQARTVASGSDGRYIFLQLPPGTYRVTFSLPGFASLVQENVVLTVGQSITLPVAMKVSGVTETVTVSTSPRVIESTRSASATTLNELTVESLPILGRKFEDLLTLTPGVSIVQGPDGDEITFAGQRGIFNNISLDGGDYNNGFFGEQAGGQRAAIDITLDAIKEFQVIATGAPAEFGRTAGGVVNVVTKSGTNRPHGSLFYFQRLESLTGELSDGTTLDGFHREQFGGTFGGPSRPTRRSSSAPSRGSPATSRVRTWAGSSGTRRVPSPIPRCRRTKRSSTATATASGWRCCPSSIRGSAWTSRCQSRIRSRPLPFLASSTSRLPRATTFPRRGTSITPGRRTRPSTSRPTARRPTASKATRRASTSAT